MPSIVVLDVDDTVYLERDYVLSGFKAVADWAQGVGIQGLFPELHRLYVAGHRGTTFNEALISLGYDASDPLIRHMRNVYRRHTPTISPLPDVERALVSLVRVGVRVAVLTGGPVESQTRKCAALDLARFADPIVYAGARGPDFDKPHAYAFRDLQESVRQPASEIVYVADNPERDFQGPTGLGWGVVRVRRPDSIHERIPTPHGIPEIRSLLELAGVLS